MWGCVPSWSFLSVLLLWCGLDMEQPFRESLGCLRLGWPRSFSASAWRWLWQAKFCHWSLLPETLKIFIWRLICFSVFEFSCWGALTFWRSHIVFSLSRFSHFCVVICESLPAVFGVAGTGAAYWAVRFRGSVWFDSDRRKPTVIRATTPNCAGNILKISYSHQHMTSVHSWRR